MIAQFAVRLICGISLAWCLSRRREITDGFFRIQMLIVMGLAVLATLVGLGGWDASFSASTETGESLLGDHSRTWLCAATAVAAYIGSFLWALGRRPAGNAAIALITVLGLALLIGSTRCTLSASTSIRLFVAASELSTAMLLGTSMVSMLLGHWHLTATGMSLEPLKQLNLMLLAATLLRIGLAIVGLVLIGGLPETDHQRLLLVLRWLAGLAGPLVVVGMVWKILGYRNTQAATGVLYVGVMLTLTGELTATLLAHELAVPI